MFVDLFCLIIRHDIPTSFSNDAIYLPTSLFTFLIVAISDN